MDPADAMAVMIVVSCFLLLVLTIAVTWKE